jgi:hypothetical protein
MTRHVRLCWGRLCWQSIVVAIAVVAFSGAQRVAAQNFKVLAPTVNEAQARVLSGQVANALRNESNSTNTSRVISIRR